MIRRSVLVLCAGALLGLGGCRQRSSAGAGGQRRIVSLAPAITETLFAIGAGEDVIAVSDYCDAPEAARRLPRVGTSITPNFEAIARFDPTLLVGESNVSTRRRELDALARTELLPWLSLDEIVASTQRLGSFTGREPAAKALAARLRDRLGVPEPSTGPRVLLLLGADSDADQELWFVRRNSLHGAALHAAGGRNAVGEDVQGPPRLSYERLLSVDPDVILVLAQPPRGATAAPGRGTLGTLERFSTLRALRERKLQRIEAPEALANGPRILGLVDKLRSALLRLGVVR